MEQTAVEWLIEKLTPSIALQQKYINELKEQAKEMEREQQSYSEEESITLLNALQYFIDRVENGTIKSKTTYKMYKELLEQFKKK